jgi:hypothetical protein
LIFQKQEGIESKLRLCDQKNEFISLEFRIINIYNVHRSCFRYCITDEGLDKEVRGFRGRHNAQKFQLKKLKTRDILKDLDLDGQNNIKTDVPDLRCSIGVDENRSQMPYIFLNNYRLF